MHQLLQKMKDNRLELRAKGGYKEIGYVRILTNKMTIVAWKFFKGDRRMHFAIILYRFKKDFGFTELEIANFTGMPLKEVNTLLQIAIKFMRSDVLKIIAKSDFEWDEELHAWRSLKAFGKRQGYYEVKDRPAWYTESRKGKRWSTKPDFQFGGETEKELDEQINR